VVPTLTKNARVGHPLVVVNQQNKGGPPANITKDAYLNACADVGNVGCP